MVHHWSLFLILILSGSVFGQDERYYRQIISGTLPQALSGQAPSDLPQFNVEGKHYLVDLNGDGIEEVIIPQKRDGVDYIDIRNSSQKSLFSAKLFATGGDGWLYKARLFNVKEGIRGLILYFDEGSTRAKRFESMARIFVLTFPINDLSQMTLTEGPHFFHEKEAQREQYWRRDYLVEIKDLDKDKVNEIVVRYHHIQRIMKYIDRGVWSRL